MRKSYESSVEVFDSLPKEVKDKAISIFGAYSEVVITYEDGKYSVGTCHCLSRYYAPDYKTYTFTKDEIKKNHKAEIEAEEERFYEESKDCDWESLNN